MKLRIMFYTAMGISLLISSVSCGALPTESPIVEANPHWMIFTKEQAEEMGVASWLVESDKLWTPLGDDILQLEKSLPAYLS